MKDSKTESTKADIQQLHDAMSQWKSELRDEMLDSTQSLREVMKTDREYIVRHMDILMESLAADSRGGARYEFSMVRSRQVNHGDRIHRLEEIAGIPS